MAAGIPIALVGLTVRAWAAGHLRKNLELTVSGPYAHSRNPLYVGSLLAAVGLGASANHLPTVGAIVIVFLCWYLPVVGEEEDHLRKILPGYSGYEERVPRFVPTMLPGCDSRERFDPALYRANREYAALGVFAAFVIVLLVKI